MKKTLKKLSASALALVLLLALLPAWAVTPAAAAVTAESESNDTISAANVISVNTEITGSLGTSSDTDWYAFTLPKDGMVYLSFSHDQQILDSRSYWKTAFFTSDSSILDSTTLWAGNTTAEVSDCKVGLAAGTYYLRIQAEYFSNDTYHFTVHFTASNVWEKERNNTIGTANVLPLNTQFSGTIMGSGDTDWYAFTLPKDGVVYLSFSHDQQILDSRSYWKTAFFTSDSSILGSTTLWAGNTTAEVSDCKVGLAAGTYYLRIQAEYFSNDTYHFTVHFTASNVWEKERNDEIGSANDLPLNTQFSGTIMGSGDADWYCFTLPVDDVVSIVFDHDYISSDSAYWKAAVYNMDGSMVGSWMNWKGNDPAGTFREVDLTAGTYYLCVRDSSYYSSAPYGISVNSSHMALTVKSVNADKTTAAAGTPITWTAAASGGAGTLRYCFYIFKDGTVIQRGDYGTAKTVTYTPPAPGAYTARVYVKDATGASVNLLSAATTVTGAPLTVSSVKASPSTVSIGDTVTWTATASGGSGTLRYCFYIFKDGAVIKRGNYGAARTFSYTPAEAGTYTARAYVKDATGTAVNLMSAGVTVRALPLTVSSVKASPSTVSIGDTVTWTATASGGSGTVKYCFYIFKDGKILQRGDYGTARTVSYAPAETGTYTVRVYVKDAAGTVVNLMSEGVAVSALPLTISSLKAGVNAAEVGDRITWTATASGGSGTLKYCFYIFKDGKILLRGDYGTAKTFVFVPDDPGTYTARVYVKDASGTVVNLTSAGTTVANSPLTLIGVAANRTSAAAGTKITWTAATTGGTGTVQYCFYLFKNGKIQERGSYGTANTYSYTPTAAGAYTVRLYVKDATGTVLTADNAGSVNVH